MISLQKTGNAIKFTFDNNGHYLQDGTIEVPVNSLTLVTDGSDMFTFKKSATNDIFVSGLYSEIGMSKSELEAFYKDNMVGSTGGGGGGITSGEVQTMIDESISGLAESSAVTLEIAEATSGKVDSDSLATVATSGSYDDLTNKPTIPTVPTSNTAFTNDAGYITEDALNGYATEQWVGEQGYITGVDLSNYATLQDIPDVSNYFDGAEYDSGTTRINFKHGNTIITYIDASDFIVDGMIDDVRIETISGASYLVIDFNTASGKEDIQIPLTDIFNPDNYYNKTTIDNIVSGLNDSIDAKLDASAYTPTDLSEYWTSAQTESAINASTSGKVDTSDFNSYSASVETILSGKQDTLVSGTNIKTINNESLLGSGNIDIQGGGGTVDQTIISGSTNAVAGGAVYNKIDEVEQVTAAALNNINDRLSEDEEVTAAGLNAVNSALGGLKLVSLSQAQYNSLATKDASTLYIIVN